jgi:hypothetical protein
VSEAEILEVLACPDIEVEPPLDVMLPDHLVPPERLATDLQVRLWEAGFLWGGGHGQSGAGGGRAAAADILVPPERLATDLQVGGGGTVADNIMKQPPGVVATCSTQAKLATPAAKPLPVAADCGDSFMTILIAEMAALGNMCQPGILTALLVTNRSCSPASFLSRVICRAGWTKHLRLLTQLWRGPPLTQTLASRSGG